VLDPTGLRIPGIVEIDDFDFVEYPRIRIVRDYPISDRRIPHLIGPEREICYYAKGSVILDRYNPGGTIVQCLEQAERVVRDAIRGRSDNDIAGEFHAYWSTSSTLVDLPEGYTGPAEIKYLRLGKSERKTPVLTNGSTWLTKADHRPEHRLSSEPALVVAVDSPLSLDPNSPWPPANLSDLNGWLAWAAPNVLGELEGFMRDESHPVASVVIRAPNGIVAFRVTLPIRFQREEFLKNRRSGLPQLLGRIASEVEVERIEGVRADVDYVFGRNMGNSRTLVGKRILLIGCGTIGGFLAQQLAQCGAGAGSGFLTLVDSDSLQPSNIGRHLLGVPYLHRNKAEACAEFLLEQLPMLAIEACSGSVLDVDLPWGRYDLVVDATGEEALSIALNERAVRNRPKSASHVFVWLMGNGALAQCILTGEPDYACLKCLKPELAGEARYRGLRPSVEVQTVTNVACGDATFTPFPVSRSVAAAALACDLVLDWVSGPSGDRFRSLTLDHTKAFQVPDGSPKSLKTCPACGAT
jgi:molybdopterin/thiamine biosynthesis adenylyltransferase